MKIVEFRAWVKKQAEGLTPEYYGWVSERLYMAYGHGIDATKAGQRPVPVELVSPNVNPVTE